MRDTAVDITEEITIGTNDFKPTSPITASKAKTIPPRGALKIPLIAAAAPAPHKTRLLSFLKPINWASEEPIEAPSAMVGPSRPPPPPLPIVAPANMIDLKAFRQSILP